MAAWTPKADRKSNILHLHDLYFEAPAAEISELMDDLKTALIDFARFNGCRKIKFNRIHGAPARFKPADISLAAEGGK